MNYSDFWKWFIQNEWEFYKNIKNQDFIEEKFLNEISPRIKQVNQGFFFLAGMCEDEKAELVITADGNLKIIPYVEDFIASAPELPNWQFTAHKLPGDSSLSVDIGNHQFNSETIHFAINEHKDYPDEIDLKFIYKHFKEEESNRIVNGVFIYLDTYLGEIRTVTSIDKGEVFGPDQHQGELIAIDKLESYLIWREKEFIEKYEGIRHNTEEDTYVSFEATSQDELPIVAIMNSTLLTWDSKASHPWMVCIDIPYDGTSYNGMPDEHIFQHLDTFENELLELLKDENGYLNIGRETGNNIRTIFFACKDFREPVRKIDQLKEKYSTLEIDYDIFKDKYWMSLNRYVSAMG